MDFLFRILNSKWGFLLFVVMCITIGILATLWAYDGDVKCIVAECRRIK